MIISRFFSKHSIMTRHTGLLYGCIFSKSYIFWNLPFTMFRSTDTHSHVFEAHKFKSVITENIVYLPSYQVNSNQVAPIDPSFDRRYFGLPEDAFVFCCLYYSYFQFYIIAN